MSELYTGYFNRNELISELKANLKHVSQVPVNVAGDQGKYLGERFGARDAAADLLEQIKRIPTAKAERIDANRVYDFAGFLSVATTMNTIEKMIARHEAKRPAEFENTFEQGKHEKYLLQLRDTQEQLKNRRKVEKEDLIVKRERRPGFYV